MFFSFGSRWGVSGRKRYHHVRDPQPFLERSPARVDIELQRPRQDTFKEEFPCCARKGRWLISFLSCLTLFYPNLSCPLPSCAFFVCAFLSYPVLSCRTIISYPFSCCIPIFCFIFSILSVLRSTRSCVVLCGVEGYVVCWIVVCMLCCTLLCYVVLNLSYCSASRATCYLARRLVSWSNPSFKFVVLSGVVCLERCANDDMSRGGTCNGRPCKRTYDITVGIISHTWYHGNHWF